MKYLLAFLLPLSCLYGLHAAGWYAYLVPVLAFIVIPIGDYVLPQSGDTDDFSSDLPDWLYSAFVYLHLPILYTILFLFFFGIYHDFYNQTEIIGLTFSVGIMLGSFGMNLGHELGHRSGFWNQLSAHLFWLPNFYMHFGIEHNLWHHKYVATDDDPASAPRGMSVYRFYFQSVFGNIRTAWKVEQQRLARGDGGLPINKVILIFLAEALYVVVVGTLFGQTAALLAIAIGVIGFLLLETVNYIEHYGLRRKRLDNGRWEMQGPEHAWNSNHPIGRIVLYELTRHPDHHLHAHKPYQTLRSQSKSPQLPIGYPGSILLALVPPLWIHRMDRELEQYVD